MRSFHDLNDSNSLTNELFDYISGIDGIVLVCVGTPRVVGDSVAPRIGSELLKFNTIFQIYGTMENPVHAQNLPEIVSDINEKHDNSLIIAIDAGLCSEPNLGKICLEDKSLRPGAGVGKSLPIVGDITIVCNVGISSDNDFMNFITINQVKEDLVKRFVETITTSFIELNDKLEKHSNNKNFFSLLDTVACF